MDKMQLLGPCYQVSCLHSKESECMPASFSLEQLLGVFLHWVLWDREAKCPTVHKAICTVTMAPLPSLDKQ